MWPITPTNHSAAATFKLCISRIRDPDLKLRLNACAGLIETAEQLYTTAAAMGTLHTLRQVDFTPAPPTDDELKSVYTLRMANKKAPGRPIYDDIIMSAPHERCPLCGHRSVTTLDHHLPKAKYPALAVTPINLIPACSDCNKAKLDGAPTTSEEETLHPYFDDVSDYLWLAARVIHTTPAAVVFSVQAPPHWSPTLAKRVELHFQTFGLAKLYAAQASQELGNIRFGLGEIHNADPHNGAAQVRLELLRQAKTRRKAHINSWQTALYQALADSEWFCNGGFA